MTAATPGFRRRRRNAGAAVLVDETAGLLQADPLGWAGRALLPSLPLALLSLVFVHLHRVVWTRSAWDTSQTVLSLALSTALLFALGLRAVGQGAAARAVAQALDPRGVDESRPLPVASLVALGWVSAAAFLLGSGTLVVTGFLALQYFLPAFAVCAVEGRDLGSTLRRLGKLPRGTGSKAFSAVVLFAVLLLFVWLDVVAGVQLGLMLLHMLTGTDVDLLVRVLGPSNGAFMLSSLVVAGFLLDGVWCLYAAVFYVDARLGQSGADLVDRWGEIRRSRGVALALLAGTSLLTLPALAQDPEVAPVAEEIVWTDDPIGEPPEAYARDLETWRAELESKLADYETSGFEGLDDLRSSLEWETVRTLDLGDGEFVSLDGSLLAEQLPEWIHTEDTAAQARTLIRRLDVAIARVRGAGPSLDAADPVDPRTLLATELEAGEYDLGRARTEGDAYRAGFQERFRDWLEEFWRNLVDADEPRQNTPQPVLPEFDGRIIMAAVAGVLGLILVLFLLGQGRTLRVAAPELDPLDSPLGGDLPDARQRSPLGWRGHADKLAAEGLHRQAIRAQYLAVLARLDRTGEIDYRRERTNGEHLRTFRGLDARRGRFGDATWSFEVAWYGEGEADAGDYRSMTELCDALVLRDKKDLAQHEAPPEVAGA